jgi:hypothetical protein
VTYAANANLAISVDFFPIEKIDITGLGALVWIAVVSFSGVGIVSKFSCTMFEYFPLFLVIQNLLQGYF